ncbi:extracellular matrix regulator RemB [Azotosporobacter soli]|jgi:extracellular matrix regulatory protein B|uniref:extracellular matrix regulator RemB n=1 Tax=Azotosporobacter soli TaxID=3055040 RepID=UPI0031FE644C
MFLHLGADTVVPLREVIAINDLKHTQSKANGIFIKNMREKDKVVDVSDNQPKSFVITDGLVYLSAISALTLKKRAHHLNGLEHDEA